MISIARLSKNITEYISLGKEIFYPIPYGCKHCGYEGRLHRHGFYSRNVISQYGIYRVFILRIKCPSCHKTYSILPSFLIPYYQYTFDLIFLCLYYVYVSKLSYSKVVNIFQAFNPQFNVSTIYGFKKRMKKVSAVTNSFFAHFDELYYAMDDKNPPAILKKIEYFKEKKGDFNYRYFHKMTTYFFAKV